MAERRSPPAEAELPLSPVTFRILVSLAGESMHGTAIVQDIETWTAGKVRLDTSTLYRSMHRLLDRGLVSETGDRPDAARDDERRRYYRITPQGLSVARAEAARLTQLVSFARAKGLVRGDA